MERGGSVSPKKGEHYGHGTKGEDLAEENLRFRGKE